MPTRGAKPKGRSVSLPALLADSKTARNLAPTSAAEPEEQARPAPASDDTVCVEQKTICKHLLEAPYINTFVDDPFRGQPVLRSCPHQQRLRGGTRGHIKADAESCVVQLLPPLLASQVLSCAPCGRRRRQPAERYALDWLWLRERSLPRSLGTLSKILCSTRQSVRRSRPRTRSCRATTTRLPVARVCWMKLG